MGTFAAETTLKDELQKLISVMSSDRFDFFMNIPEIIEIFPSTTKDQVVVIGKNRCITVIDIKNSEILHEITVDFPIKGFAEQNSEIFICGNGISVYKAFELNRVLLENIEVKSICTSPSSLFCLQRGSLVKLNLETSELVKDLAIDGVAVVCNANFLAVRLVALKVIILNHDLTVISDLTIEARLSKIILTSSDLLIVGMAKNVQIFNCKKSVLYAEYKTSVSPNMTNFCCTDDSRYLAVFDKEISFYNLQEKKDEARVHPNIRKTSISGLKTQSGVMCFAGDFLFYCTGSEIYTVIVSESNLFLKSIELPNEIKSLEFYNQLIVNHGNLSLYNADTNTIETSSENLVGYTNEGKFTVVDKEVWLNGEVVKSIHNRAIISLSCIDGAVVTVDILGNMNVYKNGVVNYMEKIHGKKLIGVIENYLLFMSMETLEVYLGGDLKNTLKIRGRVVCFQKSLSIANVKNSSVKIWNFLDTKPNFSIKCKENFSEAIHFSISENDFFLFIATRTSVMIFSLYDYKYLGKIFYDHIEHISISKDYFFISTGTTLKVHKNPLGKECRSFTLLIPEKYSIKYWHEFKQIMRNKKMRNCQNFIYNCVVLPLCCNILHIYTHQLNEVGIKFALKNKCDFIRTSDFKSPVTIALSQKTNNILDYFVKQLGSFHDKDENTLFRTEDDLVGLNKVGTAKLYNLYKSALVVPKQKLPRFGVPLKKGQQIRISSSKLINPLEFIKKEPMIYSPKDIEGMKTLRISLEAANGTKLPLDFRVSAFRLHISLGSSKSLKFLNSLLECENKNVLVTPLIKSILLYKWNVVSYWMLLQAILFNILLVLISIFLFARDNTVVFTLIQVLNSIFFIYECLQASIGFSKYIRNFWNLMDLLRIIFILLLFVDKSYDYFTTLLLSYIVLVTWVKSVSYFRIYKPTRYLINILKQCAKDIIPFLIILFYLTFTFALTAYNISKLESNINEMTFAEAWNSVYLLNLNSFATDNYMGIQWLFFILATMTNSLLLMNMIIALLGNTYSIVKENAEVADLRELAELVIETESILFWKRKEDKKEYIHICATTENIDVLETENMASYVKYMTTVVPKVSEQIGIVEIEDKSQMEVLENSLKTVHQSFTEEAGKLAESFASDKEMIQKWLLGRKEVEVN